MICMTNVFLYQEWCWHRSVWEWHICPYIQKKKLWLDNMLLHRYSWSQKNRNVAMFPRLECCVFHVSNFVITVRKQDVETPNPDAGCKQETAAARWNPYFWLLTEAIKKCVLPSLYCFLCDLTLVPLQFSTTAPFSREILNSSDWGKRKWNVSYPNVVVIVTSYPKSYIFSVMPL